MCDFQEILIGTRERTKTAGSRTTKERAECARSANTRCIRGHRSQVARPVTTCPANSQEPRKCYRKYSGAKNCATPLCRRPGSQEGVAAETIENATVPPPTERSGGAPKPPPPYASPEILRRSEPYPCQLFSFQAVRKTLQRRTSL